MLNDAGLTHEQLFRDDLDYYEGRASGIASVRGVTIAEARQDLAARHGLASWDELRHRVEAMNRGEPPTPFVLAYRALEANERERLVELLDEYPDLVVQRGTNGNDLLGATGARHWSWRCSGVIAKLPGCSAANPSTCESLGASGTSR